MGSLVYVSSQSPALRYIATAEAPV